MCKFFLMFFLTVPATVFSSTNMANVDWSFNGDGSELSYVITSIGYPSNSWTLYCGQSYDKCKMKMFCGSSGVFMDYIYGTKGYMELRKILDSYTRYHLPKSGVIKSCDESYRGIMLVVEDYDNRKIIVANSKDGSMNPPPPVLPPVSCSISGNINLAHGVLDQNDLNGNAKSVYVQVSCNREATVKVTARANNGGDVVTLRSDGSLKSKLQVNSIAGATGATLRVPGGNGTSVMFSSTLISTGNVVAGNFSGSAVAVVTII
ncbi:Uncharacterised protein [Serratia plymuthica]|uniref:MrpH family fimbial adhesin n=1 Tax=Serratia plymuthica TaxID=82996 RepID=UPI00217AC01A|nr:hypothetical protein [Serratia plymuthica]CAI1173706.1 Uncharacterised protein [Serratia plymuthica]